MLKIGEIHQFRETRSFREIHLIIQYNLSCYKLTLALPIIILFHKW